MCALRVVCYDAYRNIVCIDVVRTFKSFNRMQRDTGVLNWTWRGKGNREGKRKREGRGRREREREREKMRDRGKEREREYERVCKSNNSKMINKVTHTHNSQMWYCNYYYSTIFDLETAQFSNGLAVYTLWHRNYPQAGQWVHIQNLCTPRSAFAPCTLLNQHTGQEPKKKWSNVGRRFLRP